MTEAVDIQETEVLDISSTQAPVSVQERCSRARLTDPPDWRYRAAAQYASDLRHGQTPTTPVDSVVQYAARMLMGSMADGNDNQATAYPQLRKYMMQCWPELSEAIWHGTIARRSAISALLDTCIIKGWNYDEACMAGCPVGRTVYNLYEKLFFDLTGVRTVASWIQDYLIEPERYSRNSILLRARLMAFHGSGSAGTNAALTGMLDSSEKELLDAISKNERSKKVFDYMVQHVDIDPDVYVGLMEASIKSMNDHEFQKRLHDQEMAGSSSLEELADNLETNIRAFTSQEIQGYDNTGLDFVNQYTKILIGNSDDGKNTVTIDGKEVHQGD